MFYQTPLILLPKGCKTFWHVLRFIFHVSANWVPNYQNWLYDKRFACKGRINCALALSQAKIPQQNGSATHCVALEFIARRPLVDPLEQISELCLAEQKV
jgi:hypothetical protein